MCNSEQVHRRHVSVTNHRPTVFEKEKSVLSSEVPYYIPVTILAIFHSSVRVDSKVHIWFESPHTSFAVTSYVM